MEDLAAVDAYLRKLRRKFRNNSKLEEGVLYYKKTSDESDWKICIGSMDEKKIMESCHSAWYWM